MLALTACLCPLHCLRPLQRARANDPALHTDKTMFSCGSLAPKLQRGGGCVDHGFARWVLCAQVWAGLGFVESSLLRPRATPSWCDERRLPTVGKAEPQRLCISSCRL